MARRERRRISKKRCMESTLVYFLEKAFSLQLAHQTVVVELLGLGLGGFGAGSRPLFQNKSEHLRIEVGNALDDVDAELPTGFENFRVVGVEKLADGFLASFLIFVERGHALGVTGDKIFDRLAARAKKLFAHDDADMRKA